MCIFLQAQLTLGWTIAAVCCILVVYGIYPFNHPSATIHMLPLTTTIIYHMFQRGVWAAGVAWLVIMCHWGYGG